MAPRQQPLWKLIDEAFQTADVTSHRISLEMAPGPFVLPFSTQFSAQRFADLLVQLSASMTATSNRPQIEESPLENG